MEIKELNVRAEKKKQLEEYISEFEIGKKVLALQKQWRKSNKRQGNQLNLTTLKYENL